MKKKLTMLLVGGLLAVQLIACSSDAKDTLEVETVTSETPVEETEETEAITIDEADIADEVE